MDDFLTKPIDVALLASTLRRWTGGEGAPRSSAPPSAGAAGGADGSDAVAVLDPSRLEELLDIDPGDPSMLLRFIDRFGAGARQRLAELRDAQAAGDAQAQGRIAHGLKGTAANLGAVALAEVCRQVEELGTAGRLADDPLVGRLGDAVNRAVSALEDYAARLRRS